MSDVSASYNEQAAQYDNVIERLVPDYAAFNNLIPQVVGDPKTILDIGCGTGNTAANLLTSHPSAELTCLDTSSAMIDASRAKLGDRASFEVASIEELDPSQTYDAITSVMVLHNVKTRTERLRVYSILYDALAEGGIYASVDIFKGECEYTDKLRFDMWRQFLLEGFSEDEVDNKWLALHKEKDHPLKQSDQISMLHQAGFRCVEVVHKRLGFALTLARR